MHKEAWRSVALTASGGWRLSEAKPQTESAGAPLRFAPATQVVTEGATEH